MCPWGILDLLRGTLKQPTCRASPGRTGGCPSAVGSRTGRRDHELSATSGTVSHESSPRSVAAQSLLVQDHAMSLSKVCPLAVLVLGSAAVRAQPAPGPYRRPVPLREALRLAARQGPDVAAARAQAAIAHVGI